MEGEGFGSLPEAVLFGHSAIAAEPWSNCSASQLCSSPLLGKDDGSCFPCLLTGPCDAQAGFQQVTDPESTALPSPFPANLHKNSRNGESRWGELM